MTENTHSYSVTLETFPSLVLARSREVPVLVDFWAAWCGPCQMLMPLLARLAEEYQGKFILAKVDTEQERELAAQHGIRSLPTVRMFRNGRVVDEFLGAQQESAIRALIERHIERESDAVMAQALRARDRGEPDEALRLMRRAAQLDDRHPRVQIELSRLLIERGDPSGAREVLESLPMDVQLEPNVRSLFAMLDFAAAAQGADRKALRHALAADPGDNEARYRLGASLALAGDYEGAVEQFLEILQRERGPKEDGAHKAVLASLDLLEAEGRGDLVKRYRARLFSMLH